MTNENAAQHIMGNHAHKMLDRNSVQMILLSELFYLCTLTEVENLLHAMYCNGMLHLVGSNPFPYRKVYMVNTEY